MKILFTILFLSMVGCKSRSGIGIGYQPISKMDIYHDTIIWDPNPSTGLFIQTIGDSCPPIIFGSDSIKRIGANCPLFWGAILEYEKSIKRK